MTKSSGLQDRPVRVGVFSSVEKAHRAVQNMLDAGFTKDQITVVCSDKHRERLFQEFEHQDPAGTTTPEKAIAGGIVGAAVGGLAAIIAAATGGIAFLIAGGVIVAGAATFGGLVGAMMSRGVEKELANFYDQEVEAGKLLVAVEDEGRHAAAHLIQAERILADADAIPMKLPEG
jgi:Heat induced stress protein YflT